MHVLQGRRRGLLVIKGSPGNVPSAVDVEAGTIDAWIIDDESEEKLPFRNDPCRNTVVGYVLGRVDQKNRDAFECTAASTLLLLLLFGPLSARQLQHCYYYYYSGHSPLKLLLGAAARTAEKGGRKGEKRIRARLCLYVYRMHASWCLLVLAI